MTQKRRYNGGQPFKSPWNVSPIYLLTHREEGKLSDKSWGYEPGARAMTGDSFCSLSGRDASSLDKIVKMELIPQAENSGLTQPRPPSQGELGGASESSAGEAHGQSAAVLPPEGSRALSVFSLSSSFVS